MHINHFPAPPPLCEGLFHSLCIALAAGLLSAPTFAQSSSYAGEQTRAVKSLTAREIADLRAGKGMGFAKPAELTSFPGPMHVLEHARALALTPAQTSATEALIPPMRTAAVAAGERYIEAERELDALFTQANANEALLQTALEKSARALAEVRAAHLRAHLAQRVVLTPEQIERYDELRGYRSTRTNIGANAEKDY